MAEQVSAGVSGQVDVVIVGGGISGLYTAWRLSKSTNLSVVLLEYTSRFGGRYQTCVMPGGFPADMGAMRFFPLDHPILSKLISEFNLEIEKLVQPAPKTEDSIYASYRNKRLKDFTELKELFGVTDDSLPYFTPLHPPGALQPDPNNDFFKHTTTIGNFLISSRDISASLYHSLSGNVEIFNFRNPTYPTKESISEIIAEEVQFENQKSDHPLAGYHVIKGGMEVLTKALTAELMKSQRITLLAEHQVNQVIEKTAGGFIVCCSNKKYRVSTRKLILACNASCTELICWTSESLSGRTQAMMQNINRQVGRVSAFKIFLTYTSPWWNEHGLYHGSVITDNAIGQIVSFGARGSQNGYSTLLTSFTYNYTEIFEGLNHPDAEKFDNLKGSIPESLIPSKRLVEYIQIQLAAVLGCERGQLPDPVCACAKVWSGEPIPAANYEAKIGVEHEDLYWQSLKPFADADIFIAGDLINSFNKNTSFLGWSEGALLTSERILCNYFGIKPLLDNLMLNRSHGVRSKL